MNSTHKFVDEKLKDVLGVRVNRDYALRNRDHIVVLRQHSIGIHYMTSEYKLYGNNNLL